MSEKTRGIIMGPIQIPFLQENRTSLRSHWLRSHTWLENHVLYRVGELGLAAIDLAVSSAATTAGLSMALATFCTLGCIPSIYSIAMEYLGYSRFIISATYIDFLTAINPDISFQGQEIDFYGDGLIYKLRTEEFKKQTIQMSSSSSFWIRHVVSRLYYVALLTDTVLTRTVDGALGILGLAFSLLTLGNVSFFNKLAYRGLQAPVLLQDIFLCVANCLNPQLEVERIKAD